MVATLVFSSSTTFEAVVLPCQRNRRHFCSISSTYRIILYKIFSRYFIKVKFFFFKTTNKKPCRTMGKDFYKILRVCRGARCGCRCGCARSVAATAHSVRRSRPAPPYHQNCRWLAVKLSHKFSIYLLNVVCCPVITSASAFVAAARPSRSSLEQWVRSGFDW